MPRRALGSVSASACVVRAGGWRRPEGGSGDGPFRRPALAAPEGAPRGFMAAHGRLHEADPRTWERSEPPARPGAAGAERERAERQRHLERERARPPARGAPGGRFEGEGLV